MNFSPTRPISYIRCGGRNGLAFAALSLAGFAVCAVGGLGFFLAAFVAVLALTVGAAFGSAVFVGLEGVPDRMVEAARFGAVSATVVAAFGTGAIVAKAIIGPSALSLIPGLVFAIAALALFAAQADTACPRETA